MRTLARLCLGMIILANIGCVIVLGDGTENGTSGNGNTSSLPQPENAVEDSNAPLDAEQQKRRAEAEALIANEIYGGLMPERSVQGKSGKIYDSLRIPPLDVSVPDVQGLVPTTDIPGVTLGMTEVERYPELWGPSGTTVLVRPDFSKYIEDPDGATSIQDWIQNYQVPGVPDGQNRLYAGLDILQPNVGIYARINAFKPEVEKDTFSVIELAVACPAEGPATEMIGILIGADWANYQMPPTLDLSVEHWRWINGKREGGFNKARTGFVVNPSGPTDVGSPLEQYSIPGGEQFEHVLLMLMLPDGSWWVTYNSQILGYFPAQAFTTLNKGACRAQVYGEVYHSHPEQGWARTEMGSGQFASAPYGHVAWVREIRYLDSVIPLVAHQPMADDFAYWSKPYNPLCYNRSSLIDQGGGPIMYLGGPGGKDPVCAQWKPSP